MTDKRNLTKPTVRKTGAGTAGVRVSGRDRAMRLAREIMDENREVLRALAR